MTGNKKLHETLDLLGGMIAEHESKAIAAAIKRLRPTHQRAIILRFGFDGDDPRTYEQMAELRVDGTAGGGMVTVVVNGEKQLQSIRIDPDVVSKEDVEMLQDLIVAAVNDAHRKVEQQLSQHMQGMMGGLKIPGF